MIVADHFQQQVLIFFFIDAGFYYLIIGNKLKVLTNGSFQQPCKRIIPVKYTNQFSPNDIYGMVLPYMYKFMPDDFFQFVVGMLIAVDKKCPFDFMSN